MSTLRAQIEEAVERLLTILDALDGDPDADAEPSLGAPENHRASQIGWLRGSDTELRLVAGSPSFHPETRDRS